MSGSHLAVIIIPIVTAIALFGWLGAVLWASTHPRYKRSGSAPRNEVAGGAFRAVDGGRQLMPIPEHRPAGVPGPRTAESEAMAASGQAVPVPGQRQTASQPGYAASAGQQPPAAETQAQPLAGVAGQGRGLERGASALVRRDQELTVTSNEQAPVAKRRRCPGASRRPGHRTSQIGFGQLAPVSWTAPRCC